MSATPTTSLSFQNFFQATLTGDITASDTDIPLDTIPNGSEGFLVIDPDTPASREIIYYTSKTAVKVVCPSVADGRGQDDTSAVPHTTGATVIMAPIAAYYETLLALFTTTPQGWTSLAGTFTSPTYLGNRSYTVSTSVDQRSVLSKGQRLKFTRTVTAPVQCTSLNGTTQYYSKSSPAGMTFTDDYVASAWVKLSSYSASDMIIASRYNGTSGWELYLTSSTGSVTLIGYNAGAANISYIRSYQSIPLNKWVHITAQLDMSTFTASTTTSYVMIDGVDVPAAVGRGGTNPTALVQAGNLEIGSHNGGLQPFPGKIAQVAIFSAKVTQATMRGYMSQGLSGSETSLISAYSFNNAITDLNANANNLTANGAAVATNVDSPFSGGADIPNGVTAGSIEYGILMDISASTITVQVPEGYTIPTTGGISAASYSTFNTPYGFPAKKQLWGIYTIGPSSASKSVPTALAYYNVISGSTSQTAGDITAPVGAWILNYRSNVYAGRVAGSTAETYWGMSTAYNTAMDAQSRSETRTTSVGATTTELKAPGTGSLEIEVAAATPYWFTVYNDTGGAGSSIAAYSTKLWLENAYI